ASATGLSGPSVLPSEHPTPNHVAQLVRHLPYPPRAYNRFLAVPGFASHPASSPLHPAETSSLSCRLLVRTPAALHPVSATRNHPASATQLPSATRAVTTHGTDFHYADKTD